MNRHTYRPQYTWLLFVILAALLLFRLGATPIYILDEAKNSECAREMMQRNDFVTPVFNGVLRTDKPPLHYFFMIAAYKIAGQTPFAARLFSAIMGLLTVLVTFFYTKRHTDAFTGFCTAMVLTTSTHFLFEFRLAVPDPYLIFFITLGLFSAFTWVQEKSVVQLYIAAASLGLATLAKGPVALALPGLCVLIWVILQKKWSTVFTWHLVPAFLLLCLIAVPWYYLVDKATAGEWTKGFFITNNLDRFSDTKEGHGGIFLITFLFVILGLLPFMAFLAETIRRQRRLNRTPLVAFGVIVTLVFVIFFSISSTKLPNYPMPCYPFAAVVLGSFITALLNKELEAKRYPYYILVVITIAIPVAGYFAIAQETEVADLNSIALILLVAPAILIAGLIVTGRKDWSRKIRTIFIAYLLFNGIGLCYVYPVLYSRNPVSKTIEALREHDPIFAYNQFNPGFRFYLDKDIPVAYDTTTLRKWLDTSRNAVIITTADYADTLKMLPVTEIARHQDLFELPTTVILKQNAPAK